MLLFRPRVVAERIAGSIWSFAPALARRHLADHPNSVLGAAPPDLRSSSATRGAQDRS
jgi:hypothetical protein